MSWDIYVLNFPADAKTANDVPDDFTGKPIGNRRDMIAKIREIVPMAVFPDKSWGKIEGPGLDVEIRLGDSEIVTEFVFHVRGSEVSAACVADILRHLNLRAMDSASGDFFDVDHHAEGVQKWNEYRDQMLSQKSKVTRMQV